MKSNWPLCNFPNFSADPSFSISGVFSKRGKGLIQICPMKSAKLYHLRKPEKNTILFSISRRGIWEPHFKAFLYHFRAALQLHRQQLRHGAAQPRLGGGIPGSPRVAHGNPTGSCIVLLPQKEKGQVCWRDQPKCDHNQDDDGDSNDTNDYVLIYWQIATNNPKTRRNHGQQHQHQGNQERKEQTIHNYHKRVDINKWQPFVSTRIFPPKRKRKIHCK